MEEFPAYFDEIKVEPFTVRVNKRGNPLDPTALLAAKNRSIFSVWNMRDKYVVTQTALHIYPMLQDVVRCKHVWLKERIQELRDGVEYDELFVPELFDEDMKPYLISNMLTDWRKLVTDGDLGNLENKANRSFKYFSFPHRVRLMHWMWASRAEHPNLSDYGLLFIARASAVKRGFLVDTVTVDTVARNHELNVLTSDERHVLFSEFLSGPLRASLTREWASPDPKERVLFFVKVALIHKRMVSVGALHPQTMLWELERVVRNELKLAGVENKKRPRESL